MTTRTVRVFISSTFRDMHAERDLLVREVFPELRRRCRTLDIEVVDVDLRWGVPEEETEQGHALEICLEEIRNSKPFFLGLLGERYGWVPPDEVQSITALEITNGVLSPQTDTGAELSAEERQRIRDRSFFYLRDPAYLAEVPQEFQGDLRAESAEAAEKLAGLKDQIRRYYGDRGQNLFDGYPCHYRGQRVAFDLLDREQQEALSEVAGQDHMVDRADLDRLGAEQQELVKRVGVPYMGSLAALAERVTEDLWQAIRAEHGTAQFHDANEAEQELHRQFAKERRRHFVGRQAVLERIRSATGRTGRVVVCGAAGAGKSALLAVSAEQRRGEQREEVVIERYVGCGPASLSAAGNRDAIWRQLIGLGLAQEPEDGEDRSGGRADRVFRDALAEAASRRPVVLYLDGINQLNDPGGHIEWIHFGPQWPPGLTVVVGTVATAEAAQRRYPYWRVVDVPQLAEGEGETLLGEYLGAYGKALSAGQRTRILAKEEAGSPLYLRVVAEELRVFARFEDLDRKINTIAGGVEELFSQVLERIEVDTEESRARTALGAIACGRGGMPEQELLEYLAEQYGERLAPQRWARIHRQLRPYMKETGEDGGGMLDFFHQQLALAVRRRYLNGAASGRADRSEDVHQRLGRYYRETARGAAEGSDRWRGGGSRGQSEAVWHYLRGGKAGRERALELLTDFSFWMSRLEKGQLEGLVEDVHELGDTLRAEKEKDLAAFAPWEAFMRERVHILRRGTAKWPAHKILLQLAMEHADESPLTEQAEAWLQAGNGQWTWLRRIQRPGRTPVSNTIAVFEGHSDDVKGAIELSNGTLLSWDEGPQLRLWSSSGTPLLIMEGHDNEVNGVCEGPNGTIISWSKDRTLRIWSLAGEALRVLTGHRESVCDAIALPSGALLSCSTDGAVLFRQSEGAVPVLVQERKKKTARGSQSADVVSETITPLSNGGFLMWEPWYYYLDSSGPSSCDVHVFGSDGKEIALCHGHSAFVYGCIECIDGSILSWSADETLRLWTPAGVQRGILVGHSASVDRAVQLRDGRIVSWDTEGAMLLWTATGMLISHLAGHTDSIWGSVVRDDRTLVTWTEKDLKVTILGDPVREILHDTIDGFENGAVRVASTGAIIAKRSDGERNISLISPDASRVTVLQHVSGIDGMKTLSSNRLLMWGSTQLHLWDLELSIFSPVRETGHTDSIRDVVLLADGRLLSCGYNSILCLWDEMGSLLSTMKRHSAPVVGACEASDGTLASWSEDATLCLWSRDGEYTCSLIGHEDSVIGAQFLDDRSLLSWSSDGTARIWAEDGQNTCVLSGHEGAVYGALTVAGGHILSWGADCTLRLWMRDGTLLKTMTGHTGIIHSAIICQGGTILSCGHDAEPRLWSAEGDPLDVLQGHSDVVHGALVRDREIITWSEDRTVRVWSQDGTAWTQGPVFGEHPRRVVNVRVTADDLIVAAVENQDGSYDHHFWNRTGALVDMVEYEECRKKNFAFWQLLAGPTRAYHGEAVRATLDFVYRGVRLSLAAQQDTWIGDCYWHAEVDAWPQFLRADGSVCVSLEDGALAVLVPHFGRRATTFESMTDPERWHSG